MPLQKTATVVALGLLLGFAGVANAMEVADTRLEFELEAPFEERHTWEGDPATGHLDVDICWDEAGGSNPQGGSFIVEISASSPDWVELVIDAEQLEFTPPTQHTTEPGCIGAQNTGFTMQAPDSVPPDTQEGIYFDLLVSTEGETGTFNAPEDGATEFFFETVAGPGQPPNGNGENGDDNGRNDDNETNNTPDADTPAPAAALVLVAIMALVAWRRTREG